METPASVAPATAAPAYTRAGRGEFRLPQLPPLPLFKSRRERLIQERIDQVKVSHHAVGQGLLEPSLSISPPPKYSMSMALPQEMLVCKVCKGTICSPETDLFVFSGCLHSYHYYCATRLSMMTAECRRCLNSTRRDRQRLLNLLPAHLECPEDVC